MHLQHAATCAVTSSCCREPQNGCTHINIKYYTDHYLHTFTQGTVQWLGRQSSYQGGGRSLPVRSLRPGRTIGMGGSSREGLRVGCHGRDPRGALAPWNGIDPRGALGRWKGRDPIEKGAAPGASGLPRIPYGSDRSPAGSGFVSEVVGLASSSKVVSLIASAQHKLASGMRQGKSYAACAPRQDASF